MIDETMPDDKWEFDSEVASVFEDMLRRSIPDYDGMRRLCFELGSQYVQELTDIVDLGCSRGEAMAQFIDRFGAHNRFVGCEISEPMLAESRKRFQGLINTHVVEIHNLDLRYDYPPVKSSLTLSILTLQFIPIEYRQVILQRVYDHLLPGGLFLLVEKVLGGDARVDQTMVKCYYDLKSKNGYTQDQIDRKRISLEGVLVPVTADWNRNLLEMAGFRSVDTFWRWMNFVGFMAIK